MIFEVIKPRFQVVNEVIKILNVGDSVGCLDKKSKDGKEYWELVEGEINKITATKKYGRRYFTKKQFYPLDADDVDNNTKLMEDSIGRGYIFVKEVFGLNDKTREYAEKWVKWANENIDQAIRII